MSTTKIASPLAEAQKHFRRCEEGYHAALRVQEDARTRFVEGDDSVTDAVRQDAAKAVDWAASRLSAARESLATAERADERERAAADPDVASLIVALLQASVSAYELRLPSDMIELGEPPALADDMALPRIFVAQRKVTQWDTLTGLGKGEALIYVYTHADGPPILDSAEIVARLRARATD